MLSDTEANEVLALLNAEFGRQVRFIPCRGVGFARPEQQVIAWGPNVGGVIGHNANYILHEYAHCLAGPGVHHQAPFFSLLMRVVEAWYGVDGMSSYPWKQEYRCIRSRAACRSLCPKPLRKKRRSYSYEQVSSNCIRATCNQCGGTGGSESNVWGSAWNPPEQRREARRHVWHNPNCQTQMDLQCGMKPHIDCFPSEGVKKSLGFHPTSTKAKNVSLYKQKT